MKVSEILNDENHETRTRLLRFVDGHTYGAKIEKIKQHLVKEGTKPTLENVKRRLIHHLLLPTELMNERERSIILRAKSAE
jgi:hypothetical protein